MRKSGGERWIRTTVPEGSDLQSDAFSRSAISPQGQALDLEQPVPSVTAKPALPLRHLYLGPMRPSHRGMKQDRPRRQDAARFMPGNERPKPPSWVHLYGLHAVCAALENPDRRPGTLFFDQKKEDSLRLVLEPILERHHNPPPLQATSAQHMGTLVPDGAPHQGVVLKTRPLESADFKAVCARLDAEPGLVVVLDQVTDPQNVGAIIRSAVAFGAQAIVTTDRNAPFETGALSRAAVGGVDRLPWTRVTNLAEALHMLADSGAVLMGLDGSEGAEDIFVPPKRRRVLVLGAEGKGLREKTRDTVDVLMRLPTDPDFPHLNVSAAAAAAMMMLRV